VTGLLHIVLARKPIEGTIVENCLQWETGALWIDGTRVASVGPHGSRGRRKFDGFNEGEEGKFLAGPLRSSKSPENPAGRWPANLVLGGEEVVELFPQRLPGRDGELPTETKKSSMFNAGKQGIIYKYNDSGTASRFFFNFSEQESDE
jgi:site-specific DNA-methyltransferase (adenine-specific)